MVKILATVPFDECQTVCIKDLEAAGLDYVEAQGFIKALVKLKAAKQVGTRKAAGKGKPTNLYAVPMCIQVTLYQEPVETVAVTQDGEIIKAA
jgi:hypothetical protein